MTDAVPQAVATIATYLDVSPDAFYNFVKSNAAEKEGRANKPILERIQALMPEYEHEPYLHHSWDYGPDDRNGNPDDFYPGEQHASNGCCGVTEMFGLEDSSFEQFQSTLLHAIKSGYRHIVYYSIRAATDRYCADLGFTKIGRFKNHNTGNTVTGWAMNLWEDVE